MVDKLNWREIKRLERSLADAYQSALTSTTQEARSKVPVKTGKLAASVRQEPISTSSHRITGAITANTHYAIIVEIRRFYWRSNIIPIGKHLFTTLINHLK